MLNVSLSLSLSLSSLAGVVPNTTLSSYAAVGADGLPVILTPCYLSVDRVLVSTSGETIMKAVFDLFITQEFFGAWRRTFHVGGQLAHKVVLYGSQEMSIWHTCPNHCSVFSVSPLRSWLVAALLMFSFITEAGQARMPHLDLPKALHLKGL